MGYKLLGFAVWHGGKWYLRRRAPDAGRQAAILAAASGVVIGGIALARAGNSEEE